MTIKEAVEAGLDKDIEMAGIKVPASEQVERINFSLNEQHAQKIRRLAKERGMSEMEVVQQIAIAALSSPAIAVEQVPAGSEAMQAAWKILGREPRPAQAAFYLGVVDALSDGHIGMVETSTGSGKTMAMLMAADQRLDEKYAPRVAISVPTIALMEQFLREHALLTNAGICKHKIRAVVGRREFVSLHALQIVANHAKYIDHKDVIDRWISLSGEPLPSSAIQSHWLVSQLKAMAPGFPAELAALPDVCDEVDPGWLAYNAQFQTDDYPDLEILLCTHSMLSYSNKHRTLAALRNDEVRALRDGEGKLWERMGKTEKDSEDRQELLEQIRLAQDVRVQMVSDLVQDRGKLPPFRHLLIDEAHQFENAMASANASYLSINSFLRHAEECADLKASVTQAALAQVRKVVANINQLSDKTDNSEIQLTESNGLALRAIEIIESIITAISLKPQKESWSLQQKKANILLAYDISTLRAATKHNLNTRATLSFSPVREFPQVRVGSRSVNPMLTHLWASLQAVACISATLYLPKGEGYSAGFQANILNVPQHRLREYMPSMPTWIYTSVKGIWLPPTIKDGTRIRLRPPTASDKLNKNDFTKAESLWLDDVAELVKSVYDSAAGGTMVLMTSYDSIKKLSSRLPENILNIATIANTEDTLTEQRTKYLKLYHTGLKPLWIALGGAWTGLDVGGHDPYKELFGESLPAEEDNVLTDLIIPRIPYGLNKSLTHAYRIEKSPAIPWELLDAIFRLKQGLGRPVRRPGLPANRRFFLADARINDEQFHSVRLKIDQVIRRYSKLEFAVHFVG